MTQMLFLRRYIALGLKPSKDSTSYGQGFNYWVEVGFRLNSDFDKTRAEKALNDVLSRIDHQALGVDLKPDFEPTSTGLCAWLAGEIERQAKLGPVQVHLIRGDGLEVELASLV